MIKLNLANNKSEFDNDPIAQGKHLGQVVKEFVSIATAESVVEVSERKLISRNSTGSPKVSRIAALMVRL